MQPERIRIYMLARELGISSNTLLYISNRLGLDFRNHLARVDAEQRAQLEQAARDASGQAIKDINRLSAARVPPPLSGTKGRVKTTTKRDLQRKRRQIRQLTALNTKAEADARKARRGATRGKSIWLVAVGTTRKPGSHRS
jgi:hypothetical protein